MNRTPVSSIPNLPESLQSFVREGQLFDSSCSREARVWFADHHGGLYIKNAPGGSLRTEADMNDFFFRRGLGPEVLAYLPGERDWMVTRAIPGEDCLNNEYLADPKRLSALLGELLRRLHETDPTGCPIGDRNEGYLTELPQAAQYPDLLTSRVLLHGDYCLPNILLRDWAFSGFIDLGHGGIGDRHLDLYWGCWSILYNLKEDRWCSRFLDAYGRENVAVEKLSILHSLEFPG